MTVLSQLPDAPDPHSRTLPWRAPERLAQLPENKPAKPARATPSPGTRLRSTLRAWWRDLWTDEQTRYLSQATSLADLERRIRAWDDIERRGWPFPW